MGATPRHRPRATEGAAHRHLAHETDGGARPPPHRRRRRPPPASLGADTRRDRGTPEKRQGSKVPGRAPPRSPPPEGRGGPGRRPRFLIDGARPTRRERSGWKGLHEGIAAQFAIEVARENGRDIPRDSADLHWEPPTLRPSRGRPKPLHRPDRHAPSPVAAVSSGFSPAWLRESALDSQQDATVARRPEGGLGPIKGRPRFKRQRRRKGGFTPHITVSHPAASPRP